MSSVALPARLLARARADQIATLFTQWRRSTFSMVFGALILCTVMWGTAPAWAFALWVVAILANQAWRGNLVRRYRAAAPPCGERERWGRAWALGSTISGALWGAAGLVLFVPGDPGHQALLIVCLFGVILGGINLTSVYKPSLYGFALPVLSPLILRSAIETDQVHLFTAAVTLVVLAFILRFGSNLNNLMLQSLAIRYENTDLIGELQAQTTAAGAARAAAEAANRAKTQFLAAASHDLRQPLHAMGLFAAALTAKARDADVRNMVANINASVEALERLFSALMDISKLDAGAVAPNRSSFPIMPLLERIGHDYAPLAASKALRLHVCASNTWIESDPVLLARILSNLVSNAVGNTARGGIVIGARRRGPRIALEVWDSGVGIAAPECDRIFEEFYQIDNAERHSSKGMGLGLAIIRRLATLLDHPIEVESTPGRGSRFTVIVPRSQPLAVASLAPLETSANASLRGARIAVIDDELAVIDGMRALLGEWGAVVVSATSGEALLAALGDSGHYPDLVIADYRLGQGESGADVIARLRDELGRDIPALLISGDTSAKAIAAMQGKGLEVLLKPVIPPDLKLAAERLLATRLRTSDRGGLDYEPAQPPTG